MPLIRWFLPLLVCPALGQGVNPFDQAANEREAARQRAFDRGQRTALPAAEERESLGRMREPDAKSVRAADGSLVQQGAPQAAVYNRVMETARHFRHYRDPKLKNANDDFTDDPIVASSLAQEARRLYPALSKPDSAFHLRFMALERWVQDRRLPLAKDARKDLLMAHMVSLELTGSVIPDRYGLGQIPHLHTLGQLPPAFIKRNSFEIEVQGAEARLPDGLRGKVLSAGPGQPDVIEWLDAEGAHRLVIPSAESGMVELFFRYSCRYRRMPTLHGYRVRFTPP